MNFAQYIVRPRPSGDGFLLFGSRLPAPLRYPEEEHAIGYARWHARETGASIWLLDSHGYPIVAETVDARAPHQLGG